MNRFSDDEQGADVEQAPAPAAPATPAHASPEPHRQPGIHAMRRRQAHEPVVPAYRPSAAERFRSAFRNHRREIFAITALVVALVMGIIGTTAGMVRASRQRDAALAARAEADRLRTGAEAGRREAAAVSDFLEAVLGSVNPWGADRAAEVSVEQMLDVAAKKLDDGALAGQAEAEARVRATLGHAYAGLGVQGRAEPQFRKALALQKTLDPRADNADVARTMNALAGVLISSGAPAKVAEAEKLANSALEMRRRLYGERHMEVADSLDTLSAVLRVKRDYSTAERRVEEALAMRRALGPDPANRSGLASSLTNRAILMWRRGELTQTIADLREAMEIDRATLPEDHLLLGALHARLGNAYNSAGKRAEAIDEFRQSVDVLRRHRNEAASDIGEAFGKMAVLMVEQGQYPQAEQLLLDRDARLRALPDCPADVRSDLSGRFVCLYQAWGKTDKVQAWAQKLHESLGREIAAATAQVEKNPTKAKPYFERAKLRVRAGHFQEANDDYAKGLAIDAGDHWPWFYDGCLLAYLGDEAAYRAHCAKMLERFGSSPDGHVLDCTVKTCSLLPGAAGGQEQRLNQIANQVWALGSKDERNAAWFRLLKGMAEFRAGNADRAINWLTGALTPDLPHRTATAELYLAMAHQKLGHADEAKALLAKAEDRIARLTPKPGVGDLAEGGIENWLICQTALREARAVVGK
jgi:tetratricopeptide (TPR) repeat protein